MINNFQLFIDERNRVCDYHNHNITHHIVLQSHGDKLPYTLHFPKQPIRKIVTFDDVYDEKEHSGHCFPEEHHIKRIIDFANEIKKQLDAGNQIKLISNCMAGISRSTATAYIVLNVLAGPGREKECMEEVVRIRPVACPNPLMCTLADKLLDRNGILAKVAHEYRDLLLKKWLIK